MIVEPEVVEADLAAGRLRCPACEGPLARWGFARERQVRVREGIRSVRPRRACCERCGTTYVLLPAWAVPRRRDSAEVIGAALLDNARGLGHRRIAGRIGRPPGTVRWWLRTFARSPRRAGQQHRRALDARDRPERAGSETSVGLTGRRRRRRARPHGASLPAASQDVRITVGAGRDAHRPALRPSTRPAQVLSCAAYARVGRIARRAALALLQHVSRARTTPRGERSTAEAKRSQRAKHNHTPPTPPPSSPPFPTPPPPPFGPGVEMGVARAGDGSR
jgi:hypothetical protein